MVSCYKPYTTNIVNDNKILVVDGLITNKTSRYHIKLSYASKFYSSVKQDPLINATVSVTDNNGARFDFMEINKGEYLSDSLTFTGIPGNSYLLRIETQYGDVYESTPQKMEQEFYPDSVYAVNDYQEYISRFNQVINTIIGAEILINIDGKTKTLPKFRIDVEMIKLYAYALNIPPPPFSPPLYLFYCWQLDNSVKELVLATPLNNSSNLIENHSIYFVDNLIYLNGRVYGLGSWQPDNSYAGIPTTERKLCDISGKLMYIDQYSLNDDAYLYYKRMKEQISSEGKLFDPIAVQIEGNIKCISEPERVTAGFFEVSALNKTAYQVGLRNPVTHQVPVRKIPYIITPSQNGCIINKVPSFWTH